MNINSFNDFFYTLKNINNVITVLENSIYKIIFKILGDIMGIIKAFSGALGGTLADQWKDIITAGDFDEHTIISPGIFIQSNSNRGSNNKGSVAVISNGSKIYVPENTSALIINQGRIEEIIGESGGYEYRIGQDSLFNDNTISKSIWNQTKERLSYGGQTPDNKRIIFVNMREIRGIKFGTRGPQTYHDLFYGVDLEVLSFGMFSIKVTDPIKLMKTFIPSNSNFYSLDDTKSRLQILSEFIQSFSIALNSLSSKYRISQLASKSDELISAVLNNSNYAGSWKDRFGFELISVAIENIEFSSDSRELIKNFSSNLMSVKAYEGISQQSSNISFQQKIAQGIQEHGLGDGAGMIFGMNLAKNLEDKTESQTNLSLDEQIETLTKLKKLVDSGILSEDEFIQKKKEVMGLN